MYVLGIITLIVATLVTSNKNWENALTDEDEPQYSIAVPFIVLISMGLSFIWVLDIVK